MTLRYNDPHSGRTMLLEIVKHGGGTRQFFTYRLIDGAPGRVFSEPYPYYLDAVKGALEAARQECRRTH